MRLTSFSHMPEKEKESMGFEWKSQEKRHDFIQTLQSVSRFDVVNSHP